MNSWAQQRAALCWLLYMEIKWGLIHKEKVKAVEKLNHPVERNGNIFNQ